MDNQNNNQQYGGQQGYDPQQMGGQPQGYPPQQMYGQPQGYPPQQMGGQPQGYPPQQMYEQPQGYPPQQMGGQSQGYPPQQMYEQPQGYPPQQMYEQSQGYPPQQMYEQPQEYKKKPNKPQSDKKKKSDNKIPAGWIAALCIAIIVIIVGLASIGAVLLGKKKQIDGVKNESIKLSNASYSVTYGELFDKALNNAKWTYFKEDGEKLVQVSGDYSVKLKSDEDIIKTPFVAQFNVDNGVKLSCVSVDGRVYSLEDSEAYISSMYDRYYANSDVDKNGEAATANTTEYTDDIKEATQETVTEVATEATTQASTEATTQAATEAVTEEKANSEYILENSNSAYISKSDLTGFTAEQCRIARNEIYARHGRLFDDDELQAYFYSCSWYTGSIAPSEFNESILNEYEKTNLETIVDYEKEMGYR